MSGFLKLVTMVGVVILVLLVIATIVAATGGLDSSFSNPPA
jgi:hypothetical protein